MNKPWCLFWGSIVYVKSFILLWILRTLILLRILWNFRKWLLFSLFIKFHKTFLNGWFHSWLIGFYKTSLSGCFLKLIFFKKKKRLSPLSTTEVLNIAFQQGIFHDTLKAAKVTSISLKSYRQLPSDYHRLFTLSVFNKFFKKRIYSC